MEVQSSRALERRKSRLLARMSKVNRITSSSEADLRAAAHKQRAERRRQEEIKLYGFCLPYRFKITKKQRNGEANTNLKPGGSMFILRQLLGDRACLYTLH